MEPDQETVDAALEVGLRLADSAAELSMRAFADVASLKSSTKPDGTLVTEADLMVEDELRTILGAVRPGDGMLGEERGHTGPASQYWVIDAIDGTSSFASGGTYWGTMIAFCSEGQLLVGIADQPVVGRRCWAAAGRGGWSRENGAERRLEVAIGRGTVPVCCAHQVMLQHLPLRDGHDFSKRPAWFRTPIIRPCRSLPATARSRWSSEAPGTSPPPP